MESVTRHGGAWSGRRGRQEDGTMTERKPPGVDFGTWVDRQIREATERGAFDNLPGAGEPLSCVDAPYDELRWIKGKTERENLSYLPPTPALRKEAEDALVQARGAASERQARRIIADINEKIRAAIAKPPPGALAEQEPYDVEQVVAQWREERPEGRRKERPKSGRNTGASEGRGRAAKVFAAPVYAFTSRPMTAPVS